MKQSFFKVLSLPALLLLLAHPLAAVPLAETWPAGCTSRDVNGPHMLGCWQFKPDAVTADSSDQGHRLKLAGHRDRRPLAFPHDSERSGAARASSIASN